MKLSIKCTLLTIFCFFSLIFYAQYSSNEIKGIVKIDETTFMEFASVTLFVGKTNFVRSAFTDEKGRFSIKNMDAGTYTIRVDQIGYEPYISDEFRVSSKEIKSLPIILMVKKNNNLNEVVITAAKKMIEVKADKIIFNVANSPSASGTNGLDLLKAAPGVTLDLDNSISLLGKSNVQVYLNGVQSRLSGNDLTTF